MVSPIPISDSPATITISPAWASSTLCFMRTHSRDFRVLVVSSELDEQGGVSGGFYDSFVKGGPNLAHHNLLYRVNS